MEKGVLVSIRSGFGVDRKVIDLDSEETSLRKVSPSLMSWKSVRTLFGPPSNSEGGKWPENPRQTRRKIEENGQRDRLIDQWKMLMICRKKGMRKNREEKNEIKKGR